MYKTFLNIHRKLNLYKNTFSVLPLYIYLVQFQYQTYIKHSHSNTKHEIREVSAQGIKATIPLAPAYAPYQATLEHLDSTVYIKLIINNISNMNVCLTFSRKTFVA